mmetsp:Transcript_8912/g.23142  ORF Transcript_8912/g.23142 Transcript_8912/m.23142 type:complete len:730 (-) Transcript_8912:130-2319(-)
MAADATSKSRVLLSILKCAHFEGYETESLASAISAGFGRYECEKLLKPSGVELVNLPHSSNIEISVLRKAGGSKELLLHGVMPISAVSPGGVASQPKDSPRVWEGWLGLFGADTNLKSQSVDAVFQQSLDMGSSGQRHPRLYLTLQYLPPGVVATLPRSIASSSPLAVQGAVGSEKRGIGQMALPGTQPSGMTTQSPAAPFAEHPLPRQCVPDSATRMRRPSEGDAVNRGASKEPTPGQFGSSGCFAAARSRPSVDHTLGARPRLCNSPMRRGPSTAGSTPLPLTAACGQFPPSGTPLGERLRAASPFILDGRPGTPSGRPPLGPPPACGASPVGQCQWEDGVAALPITPGRLHDRSHRRSPSPPILARLQRTSSGDTPGGLVGKEQETTPPDSVDWRQSYDKLMTHFNHRKATWAQQRAALESSLADARSRLANEALGPCSQRSADGRDAAERAFFEEVGPMIEKLGRCQQASLQDANGQPLRDAFFAEVLAALTHAATAATASGTPLDETVASKSCSPSTEAHFPLALIEQALTRALDGGEAAFEGWLASDADARGQLEASALLSACCRRVASVRSGVATRPDGELGLVYKPEKKDPVDCLLAAKLLRLGALGPGVTSNFARVGQGEYRFAGRLRISCRVDDHCRVFVRRPARRGRGPRDAGTLGRDQGELASMRSGQAASPGAKEPEADPPLREPAMSSPDGSVDAEEEEVDLDQFLAEECVAPRK